MSLATASDSLAAAAPRDRASPSAFVRSRMIIAPACVGGIAVTGAVGVVGLSSPIVDRPVLFVGLRAVGAVGMLAIALVALSRGAGERLAALLVACGYAFALGGLTAAAAPVPFVLGRIAVVVAVLLVIYLSLSYPRGRIDDHVASVFVAVAAAGSAALLAATLLVARYPPVAGPFVRCDGPDCPANPLAVIDLGAGPSHAMSTAFGLWTTVIVFATAGLVVRRVRRATWLQRRSLGPVLGWVLLLALGFALFVAVRAVDAHSPVLTPAAVVVAALVALLPFALALGMARGRVFAVSALERMLAGLGERASPRGLQRAMARAFGDPTLRLLFSLPAAGGYVDVDGSAADLPPSTPKRAVTDFRRDDRSVAVAIHDPALAEERDVLEAAGSALLLGFENARLQAELRASASELEASRRRIALAADEERRRIEQDLHDGAQQRLVALRIKLSLLEEQVGDPQAVARGLSVAGDDIEAALHEIRGLAQGIYPSVLRDAGAPAALAEVARRLPIDVAVRDDLGVRLTPEVETAMYFCCVEALQNVAKHCRARSRAAVRFRRQRNGDIVFEVVDDGQGFEPNLAVNGHGITGMRDRLAAIGGEVAIASAPGAGTTVTGRVGADALRLLNRPTAPR